MPRFDEGEQNLKLIKGNIVLMGNPDQYGEILAENIFVEDITRAALQTLISGSNLVRGKYYRITNAVGSTLSLVVKAVTADVLDEVAVNSTNGDNVIYNITTDVATVPYADTYVPYTGATTNVNLGENGIKAGNYQYDTTPTNTPTTQGTTYWDANEETIALIMNGATQHIGLDTFYNVKNSTGTTIPKGTAVRFAGTDGNSGHLLIAPMLADGTYPSEYYMGITAEAISNGDYGKVIQFGKLRGFNTNAYNAGDILYVSTTVAGGFQTTIPTAPNNIIIAAAAVNSTNNGTIMVRATIGSNINNDEGVKITTPTAGQLLQLQSNGLWENKTKAQILGGTSSQFVKGDGTLDSNTYLTTISGISAGGELAGTYPSPTLVTSAVTGKALTGLSITGSAVVSTDSILTAVGKLQNQVNALAGGVSYQGTWNASTNSPSLSSGTGTKGYYYVVSVAGSTNLDGITDWKLGDWAIFNGTTWNKVDNTDAVISVNGYTGIVTLSAADVGAVSTVAGTANQVLVNGGTSALSGAVTLSLPQSIATTSTVRFGTVGIGIAAAAFLHSHSTTLVTTAVSANYSGRFSNQNTSSIVQIGQDSLGNNVIQGGRTSDNTAQPLYLQPFGSSVIISTLTLTNPLGVSSGGTGLSTTPTNGQIDIGNGTGFTRATLTGTANQVTVTNGAGSITLSLPQSIATTSTPQFERLGVGTSALTSRILNLRASITGAATAFGVDLLTTIQSDVTTLAIINRTSISTQATTFTLSNLIHYYASVGTFGAGSSIVNQTGFSVESNLVGATNNYGFRGLIPSGTGRWNIYMDGTANNYFAGNVQIGSTTPTAGAEKLQVTGTASISSTLLVGGAVTGSSTAQFTKLGLGGAVAANTNVYIIPNITGNTTFFNVSNASTIQSDVTGNAQMYRADPSTAASTFTLGTLINYQSGFNTKGAGSTITEFIGYNASDTSVATTTIGYRSNVNSGTNKWGFYGGGTAANYFNGNVQIGSTTATAGAEKLQVTGTASVSGALSIGNTVQVSVATPSTHKVTIVIGGVTYYLLATNV